VLGTISLFLEFRLLIETLVKEAERSTRISVWEQKRAISDAISDMEEFDAARYGDLEAIKAKTALRDGWYELTNFSMEEKLLLIASGYKPCMATIVFSDLGLEALKVQSALSANQK